MLPVSTDNVDTTLSLAINPLISDVTTRQSPSPNGANTGAINPATEASMLSDESLTILKCQLKYVFGKIAGQLDKSEYNQENTTHFTDRAKCHVRPDQKDCSYKDQADRQNTIGIFNCFQAFHKFHSLFVFLYYTARISESLWTKKRTVNNFKTITFIRKIFQI